MSVKNKLVDFSRAGFILEPRYYFYGWSKTPVIKAQAKLATALKRGRTLLPRGYNFKIWDCQRPLSVQIAMLASFRKRIALLYPHATVTERKKILYSYGAKPLKRVTRPDTHRNGGAIDLTIVDRAGHELYMGTDHDDLTDRAATNYFAAKKKLSALDREALKNRALLIRVLTKAGLENYSREWWHWYIK